jgi:nucleoside-diphosphate-sugar epimerase
MSKTVLVIGANSALAKDALPVLARENTVITAGRQDCDVYCDVAEAVTIPENVDVVINFAAHFGGTGDEEISDAVRTNVIGMLNICKAAKQAGVAHTVNISSIFTVLDKTSPSYSIYALTKKQADELAEFYCRTNGISLATLRPSRIYGDSDNFAKNQPFLYHLFDMAQQGEDITLYGTHDASRNYLHSADLAEIIARVVAAQVNGTYACVYPTNNTYSQIAQAAQKVFGRGGNVVHLQDKPNIPDDTFPLDQSLYTKIDYQPSISIEDGIRRVKQYRERKQS